VELSTLAGRNQDDLDVITGALLIARDAYPGLEIESEKRKISELAPSLVPRGSASEIAGYLSRHFYGRLGFRGNADDYYDPRNSYLNQVLERRLGIPISLALLYVELARAAGAHAEGVGFPGHFLVRIRDERGHGLLIDPFHEGAELDAPALRQLSTRFAGAPDDLDPRWLAPASGRSILVRMLSNLRGIYTTSGNDRALLLVLTRLSELLPEESSLFRDRGLLAAKLGAPRAALADLARYLDTAGELADRDAVLETMRELEDRAGPSSSN
jgi:regulator of sirC expression with transglutaminase-like and TPR domain